MQVVIRARKFLLNKLLNRKQMIIDVIHTDQCMPSKTTLKEKIADKFKCDKRNVVLFGFTTQFGGDKSSGFCLIYDNMQYMCKYEPKHRLRKAQIIPQADKGTGRKVYKEVKKKCKKTRGTEITKLKAGKIRRPGQIKKAKEDFLKTYK